MSLRSFCIVALLFGSLFVFVVPPFQVADEFNHFYRAWQVSDGIFVGIRTTDNRLGGDLPVAVAKITQPFRSLPFHFENQIKSNTIFYNLSVPLDENNRQFTDFANTAIYAPTAYLPQAVAISIGKFLGIGPLSIFYFSRFLTLLFWLSMVYAALKILPIQRNLFVGLALLPSSLFINASASGDVVTNACSFLFIALCLKMMVEKKRLSKQINLFYLGLVFLTSLIMSLNKLAYFPLVFLFLLIKKEHVNGLKNKMGLATALIVSNLVTIIFWSKTIQSIYLKFEDYNPTFRVGQQLNENVDPSVQLQFIIHNPLFFSKIATFSLLKTLPHTLIHYVGKFGWEKNYLPLWLIVFIILLLIVQAVLPSINLRKIPSIFLRFGSEPSLRKPKGGFLRRSQGPLSIKTKFALLGIGILTTYSFVAAMYGIWCPVGSDFIENLGGKYFIPIYPLFFLALPTYALKTAETETAETKTSARCETSPTLKCLTFLAQPQVLFYTLQLSLIWSVIQVITRYYE
jgi:uncharacterized membrane protein